MAPTCTAFDLYQRDFPCGHSLVPCEDWQSWTKSDIQDDRLRLLYSGFAALAMSLAWESSDKQRDFFHELETGSQRAGMLEHVTRNCPHEPNQDTVAFIAQQLSGALAKVEVEMIGITGRSELESGNTNDNNSAMIPKLHFVRGETTGCGETIRAVFVEVPSWPGAGFVGLRALQPSLPGPTEETKMTVATTKMTTTMATTTTGTDVIRREPTRRSAHPMAAEPAERLEAVQLRAETLQAELLARALEGRRSTFDSNDLVRSLAWIAMCATICYVIFGLVSLVGVLGEGLSFFGRVASAAGSMFALLSTSTPTVDATRHDAGSRFTASYAKVPLVRRRELDATIPLFHDMFKDARYSLTELKAVYGVSVANLGIDEEIITLSRDLDGQVDLLGRAEKLGKDAFEEWYSGVINDFHALWDIETRLQHWHEDVLPPPDSDSIGCLLFGWFFCGPDMNTLEAAQDVLWHILVDEDGFRPLLKNVVLNRTDLVKRPLAMVTENLHSARDISDKDLRRTAEDMSVKLMRQADLVRRRREAEARQQASWMPAWSWSWSWFFSHGDFAPPSSSARDNGDSNLDTTVSSDHLSDTAAAVKDLARSFTIFTSLTEQVHITLTLDENAIKAEISELKELSSRIDRFADFVRKERNPRLGWLREIGAEANALHRTCWDILEYYHVMEVAAADTAPATV